MKVAVFGAGGVGGYVGGRLAESGAEVHLIARGEHLQALREDGLRVRSPAGDVSVELPATDDPAEVGPCDYVLFCVKSFDTEAAAADLAPLLGDGTAVVSLQNGVDNERVLADAVGEDHVVGGVAYILSTIAEPGVIAHESDVADLVVGELDGRHSDRVEAFRAACASATGLDCEVSTDVEADLWEKFAFICALSGMTAAVRLPVGAIRSTDESWAMFERLLEEVVLVAAAAGIDLPDDTVDRWVALGEDLDEDGYSSLHYDMTHGKRMELDALHGAVVERAREMEVEAPMHEAVYGILGPWAERNAQGSDG